MKKYIDPRNGFKVKIIGEIRGTNKVLVKPYKMTIPTNHVFDNKYIIELQNLIQLNS